MCFKGIHLHCVYNKKSQSAQAKHSFMLHAQLANDVSHDEVDHRNVERTCLLLHWWMEISIVMGEVFCNIPYFRARNFRSSLATKYFSLAIGIWPFFSELDLCEEKWRPNSLIWLLDSDLKFRALIYVYIQYMYRDHHGLPVVKR
jgi:hypothetical protein